MLFPNGQVQSLEGSKQYDGAICRYIQQTTVRLVDRVVLFSLIFSDCQKFGMLRHKNDASPMSCGRTGRGRDEGSLFANFLTTHNLPFA